MKTSVKVDGILLTRKQVERAYKDLNTPTLKGGDFVDLRGIKGIVVADSEQRVLRDRYKMLEKDNIYYVGPTGEYYTISRYDLESGVVKVVNRLEK